MTEANNEKKDEEKKREEESTRYEKKKMKIKQSLYININRHFCFFH
jgi:hypothetical protein